MSNLQLKLAALTGAAFTTGMPEPSHVLTAIGLRDKEAEASFQFSLGRQMLGNGVDEVIRFIGDTLRRLAANGWTSLSSGQLMSG
ncbi:hypothetical protein [Polymorphum gilvum]|uniref:hypothetical protein n=1 Tax=Polymorphum gilvum TaxID=991904 RepID=UPI0011D26D7E|nr:hypothetical protein [Polymorphum gilvum]